MVIAAVVWLGLSLLFDCLFGEIEWFACMAYACRVLLDFGLLFTRCFCL